MEYQMGVEQNAAQNPPPSPVPPLPIALSEADMVYLNNNFRYHPPVGDQQARYELLRAASRALAIQIMTNVKPSRERSTALTMLENSMFWSNSGIARNG